MVFLWLGARLLFFCCNICTHLFDVHHRDTEKMKRKDVYPDAMVSAGLMSFFIRFFSLYNQ